MAFIPYVPDLEKWKKHFIHMADGKIPQSHDVYILGQSFQHGGKDHREPMIQLITPTAQAVKQAAATVKPKKPIKRQKSYAKLTSNKKRQTGKTKK